MASPWSYRSLDPYKTDWLKWNPISGEAHVIGKAGVPQSVYAAGGQNPQAFLPKMANVQVAPSASPDALAKLAQKFPTMVPSGAAPAVTVPVAPAAIPTVISAPGMNVYSYTSPYGTDTYKLSGGQWSKFDPDFGDWNKLPTPSVPDEVLKSAYPNLAPPAASTPTSAPSMFTFTADTGDVYRLDSAGQWALDNHGVWMEVPDSVVPPEVLDQAAAEGALDASTASTATATAPTSSAASIAQNAMNLPTGTSVEPTTSVGGSVHDNTKDLTAANPPNRNQRYFMLDGGSGCQLCEPWLGVVATDGIPDVYAETTCEEVEAEGVFHNGCSHVWEELDSQAVMDDWQKQQYVNNWPAKFGDTYGLTAGQADDRSTIMAQWVHPTNAEKNALASYTGSAYEGINQALRSGLNWEQDVNVTRSELMDKISELKSHTGLAVRAEQDQLRALEKQLRDFMPFAPQYSNDIHYMDKFYDTNVAPTNMIVRRGDSTHFDGLNFSGITGSMKPADFQKAIGTVVQEHGYLSTTLANSGHSVMYTITVPKGARAVYIQQWSRYKNEWEVLIDRGQHYRITAIDRTGGKTLVSLTLLK